MELPIISSRDNQFLKLARALEQKKVREQQGLFLVEGVRLAEEALTADVHLSFALFAPEALATPRSSAIAAACAAAGTDCFQVREALLQQISQTQHSQGVLLVAQKAPPIPPEQLPQDGCLLVLDRLADPGNLGTILRTAHAAGAKGVLLTPGCADLYNPKAVRAAMGAVFKLPVLACATEVQALTLLQTQNRHIYAAAAGGEDLFRLPRLTTPVAWVLGAEADGVSDFWLAAAHKKVGLPMTAGAESLNVAAAAAVFLYETKRSYEY